MTPKEKAQELVEKFLPNVAGADRYNYNLDSMNRHISIQCAIIAVEEILDGYRKVLPSSSKYWEDVLSELRTLA